jgi:hypothetical protein
MHWKASIRCLTAPNDTHSKYKYHVRQLHNQLKFLKIILVVNTGTRQLATKENCFL